MNSDELYKVIEQAVANAVEKVVPPTVERVVNGKILKVQETLDTHIEATNAYWEKTKEFMDRLQPVSDGLFTLNSISKFLKWLGLPALGVALTAWFMSKF